MNDDARRHSRRASGRKSTTACSKTGLCVGSAIRHARASSASDGSISRLDSRRAVTVMLVPGDSLLEAGQLMLCETTVILFFRPAHQVRQREVWSISELG